MEYHDLIYPIPKKDGVTASFCPNCPFTIMYFAGRGSPIMDRASITYWCPKCGFVGTFYLI